MSTDDASRSIDPILMGMLLGAMPLSAADEKAIKAALKNLERARDQYHQRIIQANKNGASVRDIAVILGVSHQTVHNIITAHS